MLHGIIRAATAALLFVIAILVYTNYVRQSDAVLPEHSELASAPEVPQVPLNLDGAPGVPTAPASSSAPAALADLVQLPSKPRNAIADSDKNATKPRQQRAEIIDSGELAEVVDLPPSNRPHGTGVQASAQPPARPAGKRTHMVQPGESLWVISKKYLGNGELNGKIAEVNGLTSRDRIKAGQVLIIPDLNGSPVISDSMVARATIQPVRSAEDLADDDDARRVMRISSKPDCNCPALMNTTVQNKF